NGYQPIAYVEAQQSANTISRYQKDHIGDGNYRYGYNTTNGITKAEAGRTKNPEAPVNAQANEKDGCYSYTSPEGAFVSVVYIADEKGYHPKTRITYPGTARHEQHKSYPCAPLDSIPEPGPILTHEMHHTQDPGILYPTTPAPCPNPPPCTCPDEFREPFAFHTLDGSYVLVTFVLNNERIYKPFVQVLPPGWRNFYTCKIETPVAKIPGVTNPLIIYP
ncbi:unnamed protein product, partial [Allacma fusca]